MREMMSDLNTMLMGTAPEKFGNDPILRAALIKALLAAPMYAPVMDSAEVQAQNGGVSLMTTPVDGVQHILIFSDEDYLKDFAAVGTRFAKVVGAELFPLLSGNHAILNPGSKGLKLAPEDIAEINSDNKSRPCGTSGHVHGPDCQH